MPLRFPIIKKDTTIKNHLLIKQNLLQPFKELFANNVVADHRDLDPLILEVTDDGDIVLTFLLSFLDSDHLGVTLLCHSSCNLSIQ